MKKQIIILTTMLLALCSGMIYTQIPHTLSYQGVLTDSLGNPKPDGSYTITFRLYESNSGGSAIWSEQKTLQVKRGLFSTILGDQVPYGAAVKFDKPYWIGLQIEADPELTPRIPLSAVGYSLNSAKADTAKFAHSAPQQVFVDSARIAGTIPDNEITTAKILDGAIQRADVQPSFKAPYSDTSDYAKAALPSGGAGGDLTGTFPNPIIAVSAVTTTKLADGSVTSEKISDATIVTADISDNAITSQIILDGTIQRVDVAPTFISPYSDTAAYARVAPQAGFVDSARIAGSVPDNSITNSKLANGSVTSAKIHSGQVVKSLNSKYDNITLTAAGGATITSSGDTIIINAGSGGGTGIQGVQNTNNTLDIIDPNGPTTTINVKNSGITSAQIADAAVGTNKIADNTITSAKITDGTIVTADLGDNSTTSAKIVDGTIATADLADNSVTSAKIADGTITTVKVANSAVTNEKIADGTITGAKIAQQSATNGQVLKWNGTSWSPGNDLILNPGGSNGQIQFNNNNAFGGDANLFWDNTNKRLGIGSSSPAYPLFVSSSAVRSIHAESSNDGAAAIFGAANHVSGSVTGVRGTTVSTGGTGVWGDVTATTGVNYGVRGLVESPDGYSGYFTGGKFYIQGKTGIGTTTPASLLHVHSQATNTFGITPLITISDNLKVWNIGMGLSDDRFSIASEDYTERLAILKSNGNVGIGTVSPGAKLEVAGQVKITGGTPGTGKVLTSDATGLASWQDPQTATWLKNGNHIYYNTGNVAIGTTFPRYELTIYQDNDPFIGFYNSTSGTTGTDGFTIGTSATGSPVWIWNWENSNMHFGTNNTNRMIISADGRVSMMSSLDLNTEGIFGSLFVKGKQALWWDGTYFSWGYDAVWNYFADRISIGRAVDPGASYMLWVQGTAYTTGSWSSSDIRFKRNILPISGALEKVLKVSGSSFEFRNDEFKDYHFAEGKQFGFIAQEIEKEFPEVVKTESDGYKSVNYNGMIPVLLEAVKEQQKIIEDLQKRIEELETRTK